MSYFETANSTCALKSLTAQNHAQSYFVNLLSKLTIKFHTLEYKKNNENLLGHCT